MTKNKITLSKNKPSYPAPWFTNWNIGGLLYFSWYKDGDEHVVQLTDLKALEPLKQTFKDSGFVPKYQNWFSIGSRDGKHFIEWSEDGQETISEISLHGAIKLKEHFLALNYEQK